MLIGTFGLCGHTRHYNKHTRYHTTAEETGAQRNCVNSPRSSKFKTQSLIAPLALAYAIKLCWGRRVQKLSATGHSLHLNTTVSRIGGHRGHASTNTHQDSTLGTVASDRSSLPMSNCHDRAQAMPEEHGPQRGWEAQATCLLLTFPRIQRATWLHLQAVASSCTQKPTRFPQLLKTMPKSKEGRDGCGTAQDST